MRLYTRGLSAGLPVWASGVIRIMLLRTKASGQYVFDADHDYVSDITSNGGEEITVSGYARQTLGSTAVNIDDTDNRIEYAAADVDFGTLSAGENVYAIVLYVQVGGDDTTPGNDILIGIDYGRVPVVAAADAALNDTTIWVEPLLDNLPSGAAVDFGGGATGTLDAAASRGDRSITIAGSGIAAAVTAGDTAADVATTRLLAQATPNALAYLQASNFSIEWNDDVGTGIVILQSSRA